jgi:hypothetical protein
MGSATKSYRPEIIDGHLGSARKVSQHRANTYAHNAPEDWFLSLIASVSDSGFHHK